jgi:hypothetical protein
LIDPLLEAVTQDPVVPESSNVSPLRREMGIGIVALVFERKHDSHIVPNGPIDDELDSLWESAFG